MAVLCWCRAGAGAKVEDPPFVYPRRVGGFKGGSSSPRLPDSKTSESASRGLPPISRSCFSSVPCGCGVNDKHTRLSRFYLLTPNLEISEAVEVRFGSRRIAARRMRAANLIDQSTSESVHKDTLKIKQCSVSQTRTTSDEVKSGGL